MFWYGSGFGSGSRLGGRFGFGSGDLRSRNRHWLFLHLDGFLRPLLFLAVVFIQSPSFPFAFHILPRASRTNTCLSFSPLPLPIINANPLRLPILLLFLTPTRTTTALLTHTHTRAFSRVSSTATRRGERKKRVVTTKFVA